jgi:hypothetical protein
MARNGSPVMELVSDVLARRCELDELVLCLPG